MVAVEASGASHFLPVFSGKMEPHSFGVPEVSFETAVLKTDWSAKS